MCVSGCKNHYETVFGAGVKAKSVTTASAGAFYVLRRLAKGGSEG